MPSGILRLGSNGAQDNTFNPGQTGVGNQAVYDLARQADGKVLVGGSFTQYNGTSARVSKCLLRLSADGSLNNVPKAVPGVTYA